MFAANACWSHAAALFLTASFGSILSFSVTFGLAFGVLEVTLGVSLGAVFGDDTSGSAILSASYPENIIAHISLTSKGYICRIEHHFRKGTELIAT